MSETNQPAIMVPEADMVLPKNGDTTNTTKQGENSTERNYPSKVTFAKMNRVERREYGCCGREKCGGPALVVVALVVASIALLFGFIGLANTGNIYVDVKNEMTVQQTVPVAAEIPETTDRVWTFAIGDYSNRLEYVEPESGQVKGYNIDVVNAVCKIAKKSCRLDWDDYNRCWESIGEEIEKQGGGIGLLGRWYDACTGWPVTYRRLRTFSFTEAHAKKHLAVFMVKSGTPQSDFNWRNITGKTIGLLRYYIEDEDCIQSLTEVVGLTEGRVINFLTQQDLLSAVNNGEVDAVFISEFLGVKNNLKLASDRIDGCALQGYSMMMRKDNTLATWWNPALNALIASTEYREICNGLEDESIHGSIPGPSAKAVCIGF
ncbi:L-arginine-binding protein-like [Asterias amurensis]|uniref:L-arginine-binding protein-like n=1 Tax=Asterias amurensis TaxID=7602 RepID=UPI003AB418FA